MTAQEIYKALDNIHYAIIHSPLSNKIYQSDIEALVILKKQYKEQIQADKLRSTHNKLGR